MKKILLLCIGLLSFVNSNAQNPTLIKDISQGLSIQTDPPSGYTEFYGKVYFCATDSTHGRELWVTDGTSAGTNIVKDINTQSPNGVVPDGYGCPYFGGVYTGKLNGELFFNGLDTTNGMALWKTDGTTNGTVLVKDISELGFYTSWQNATSYFHSEPINNKLVFVSSDTVHGEELWVTDGTSAGTQLLKDIYQGQTSSDPSGFTLFNNKLYFVANDSTHGHELWATDGTTAGTQLVLDIQIFLGDTNFIHFSSVSPSANELYVYNNELYFRAFWSLYKTDGTASGTVLLSDSTNNWAPKVRSQQTVNTNPHFYFTEMGGKLYFIGEDSTNNKELWTTNGTQVGTHLVKEINPTGSSLHGELVSINNNKLIFYARPSSSSPNWELWESDGTANGTSMLHTLVTVGLNNQIWRYPYVHKNKVYFNARSDSSFRSWWVSDGTTNGTHIVDTGLFIMQGKPITYNDRMYLLANNQLWESEGDSSTTKIIRPIGDTTNTISLSFGEGYNGFYDYVEYNGSLIFTADWGTTGNEPWKLTSSPMIPIGVHSYTDEPISLLVYPNPTSSKFIVRDKEKSLKSIWVYNSIGQLVYENKKRFMKTEIETTGWAKGIYYLKIEKGNNYYSQSIVVE